MRIQLFLSLLTLQISAQNTQCPTNILAGDKEACPGSALTEKQCTKDPNCCWKSQLGAPACFRNNLAVSHPDDIKNPDKTTAEDTTTVKTSEIGFIAGGIAGGIFGFLAVLGCGSFFYNKNKERYEANPPPIGPKTLKRPEGEAGKLSRHPYIKEELFTAPVTMTVRQNAPISYQSTPSRPQSPDPMHVSPRQQFSGPQYQSASPQFSGPPYQSISNQIQSPAPYQTMSARAQSTGPHNSMHPHQQSTGPFNQQIPQGFDPRFNSTSVERTPSISQNPQGNRSSGNTNIAPRGGSRIPLEVVSGYNDLRSSQLH
jgi:hypothetical protein